MPTEAPIQRGSLTLPFDKFWTWFRRHRNCILRAGTPYAMLLDHESFHWDVISEEEDGTEVLQLLKGKELIGEIVVVAADITYVHCPPGDPDQHMFECVVETATAREVVYHFVLAHGFDEEPTPTQRWTH